MKDKKLYLVLLFTFLSNIFYSVLMGVHIDDVIFISFSEKILNGNLNPLNSSFIWNGKIWPDMLSYSHPPLLYYFMALIEKFFGKSIIALHISFIIFPLIIAISIYFLLKKYVRDYFYYSILFALLPLVSFTSHTLMMDIPSFSFFLCGIVLIDYGLDEEKKYKILLGSILGGLSTLISLNSIFFIPLSLLLYFLKRKRLSNLLLVFLPSFLFFSIWVLIVYLISGRFLFRDIYLLLSQMKQHSYNLAIRKGFYFFISVGILGLFSPFFILFTKDKISKKILIISLLIFFIPSEIFLPEYRFYGRLFLLFIFFSTIYMFYILLLKKSGKEVLFYKLWILFFLIYETLISPHGAARYYLIILPPIILIFLKLKDKGIIKIEKKIEIIFFTTILLISTLVNIGDVVFSRGYKKLASEITEKYSGKNIWYACHWELGYYLNKKGGKQILQYDTRVNPGDILIKTEVAPTYKTNYEKPPFGKKIEDIKIYPEIPIYVMNKILKCGLYSDYWGFYPFKIFPKKIPLEKITIFKVIKKLPDETGKKRLNYGFYVKNGKMLLHLY